MRVLIGISFVVELFYAFCFSGEELIALGIKPANREGALIRIGHGNWDSAELMSHLTGIVLREFMGYTTDWHSVSGGALAWAAIGNNEVDVVIEMWDYYPDLKRKYTIEADAAIIYGTLSFAGESGWYQFDYSQNQTLADGVEELCPIFGDDYIFLDNINFYRNPKVVEFYASGSIQSIIEKNETLRQVLMDETGMDAESVSVPSYVFDPHGCYNTSRCLEVIYAFETWEKNNIQMRIRNLNLPMYATWWKASDNSSSRYKHIIYEFQKQRKHLIFSWYYPDILVSKVSAKRLWFRPNNAECTSNVQSNVLDGSGSVDCDHENTKLDVVGRRALIRDEVNNDAIYLFTKISTTSAAITEMINANDLFENSGTYEAYENVTCEWLKKHNGLWLDWVQNTYIPPSNSNTLSTDIIIFIIFGSLCFLCFLIHSGWKYGFFQWLEKHVLNEGLLSFLGITWDTLEVISLYVAFFTSIQSNSKASRVIIILYCVVIALASAGYVGGVYVRYQAFVWNVLYPPEKLLNADVEASISSMRVVDMDSMVKEPSTSADEKQDPKEMLQQMFEQATVNLKNTNADLVCLALLDIPQSFLGLYFILAYKETDFIFIICLTIQLISLGMYIASVSLRMFAKQVVGVGKKLFEKKTTLERWRSKNWMSLALGLKTDSVSRTNTPRSSPGRSRSNSPILRHQAISEIKKNDKQFTVSRSRSPRNVKKKVNFVVPTKNDGTSGSVSKVAGEKNPKLIRVHSAPPQSGKSQTNQGEGLEVVLYE